MKGYDADGQLGPKKPLPDAVQIFEPPVDKVVLEPSSEQREPVSVPVAAPQEEPYVPPQDSAVQQQEAYNMEQQNVF